MSDERLRILSRSQLETFLICQRRFKLRYLDRLPWPLRPISAAQEQARQEGELFHQLLAQHFLALNGGRVDEAQLPPPLRGWWRQFLRSGPRRAGENEHEDARFLVETSLTVPVGGQWLTGRFDLLRLGLDSVAIFDWKTGRPRSREKLRDDWQTRLYLALVMAGRAALGLPHLAAERVSMTYWYADQPDKSQKISYSQEWHAQNWGEIERLVAAIDARPVADAGAWPLTVDLTACATCAYRAYCGRFEAAALVDKMVAAHDVGSEDDHDQLSTQNGEAWAEIAAMEPQPQ